MTKTHLRTAALSLVTLSALSASSTEGRGTSASGVSSLLTHSISTAASSPQQRRRRLEDDNNNYNQNAYYAYDLSEFSVRYEKCQYVRSYDDDLAADEDASSPLAMKHFVLFRLCPTDVCSADAELCNESENYGKYMTDVDTYLQYTVEQQQQIFENYCDNCNEQDCGGDNGDCYTECGETCSTYGNMEDAGLVDASEFIECQQFDIPDNEDGRQLRRRLRRSKKKRRRHRRLEEEGENNEDDRDEEGEENQNEEGDEEENNEEEEEQQDDDDDRVYIGPKCSGGGIVIGLFQDENCWEPLSYVDLDGLLEGELSYYFLEHTFVRSSYDDVDYVCLTCEENDENANENDENDADQVNEMCEGLYNAAAKCETPTGITAGFIQTKRDNGQYENQVETEFLACSFIDSLLWNSYNEKGEIDYVSRQDVYLRVVTRTQGIVLGLIFLNFFVLFGLIRYFQQRIAAIKGASGLQADGRGFLA